MKKKQIKRIKAWLATQDLKGSQEAKTYKTERVLGIDIIKSGIGKLPDGTNVDPDLYYTKRTPVLGTVNHVNKIKELIKSGHAKINIS